MFGTGTVAEYVNGELTISNLPEVRILDTYNVILKGSNSKGSYEVTVPVTLN